MVLGLALPGAGAAPAVRRPAFSITLGPTAGGAALGGLDGLAAAVGDALGVDLGGGPADPWRQHVAAITLDTGLAPFPAVLTIDLAPVGQPPAAAEGDSGAVALGYDDAPPAPVFSGAVDAVRHAVTGATRITLVDGGAKLARLRLNQSFEQQSAGAIVRGLCAQAEVETDTIADGNDHPFRALDDRRSAYGWIALLARESGFIAHITAEGKLRYAPFNAGQPVQSFAYGVDILAIAVTESARPPGEVHMIGEGAAGNGGQAAWSHLLKDAAAVTERFGSGAPARVLARPALRSTAAVRAAATAEDTARDAATRTGWLLAPGAPAVTPGSAFEVTGAPAAATNGMWLAQKIRHRYSKSEGFTTLIEIRKVGESGSGVLDLLGGLL